MPLQPFDHPDPVGESYCCGEHFGVAGGVGDRGQPHEGAFRFRGVTCFLDGYDYAARRSGSPGLDGFRDWLLANHLRRHSSFAWPGLVEQIALPEWDFVTDLNPEQEIRTLEVLFDLLDRFLAEREAVS